VWKGFSIPDVVRSGNHGAIKQWRQEKAAKKSVRSHFLWVRNSVLSQEEKNVAKQYIPAHYVALLHDGVLIGENKEPGTTSVTSLDIHDIARSARTYGLKKYFIVTPLLDQQKIVTKLLGFWQGFCGIDYNPSRHEAVNRVHLNSSLQQVIEKIKQEERKDPVIIATSAQLVHEKEIVSFYDQERVWELERPVLILLGTGRGIASSVMDEADFMFPPVYGFSDYNHLSVRSAAAIIFDRWLGINQKRFSSPLSD
jgi:tRNA (guanine37-N1)-methyltransferase